MKERRLKLLEDLEKASEEGVLIYQEEKLATPTDIVKYSWVREDMPYMPDFIVVDEAGKLKEIWYGKGRNNKRE